MTATRFAPSGPLRGTLRPPPDKSISHRAALVAAMAEGESVVRGYLDAADTRSTLAAIERLGAAVKRLGEGGLGAKRPTMGRNVTNPPAIDLRITGIGLRGPGERWSEPGSAIDVGNAGTLLRLLPGWLAGQERGRWAVTGDKSIQRRPIDRVIEPLRLMGADVSGHDGDRLPPLLVAPSPLRAIDYRPPIASAQVKSCVLLAGLLADGETTVTEPSPSRDHTERMLAATGAPVRVEDAGTPVTIRGALPAKRVRVGPVERLEPVDLAIPGDFSSAAFAVVAALLVPGSEVRLEEVGLNPTRVGLLGILNRMGAAVEVVEGRPLGGEPRGALVARSGPLHGTRVAAGEVALAIDELPLVALAGCFAEGETVVRGAAELRHKESDRIAGVVEALRGLGADVEPLDDGFAVRGTGGLGGGQVEARGDHRLAMLGAVAGLASRDGVDVTGAEAAAISYPGFERDLDGLVEPG